MHGLGIKAAKRAEKDAREALHELVQQIILFRQESITSLIIKAQAMQAWEEVPAIYQQCNPQGLKWCEAIASTVIRQTGGLAV